MQWPPTATPGRWMWLNGWEFDGVDDVVDVDAERVGGARELVGERDVHVAVRRLGELGQLGRLGAAHRPHLGVEERARRARRARCSPAALRPPTSFGYVARSRKTRPLNTRSGLNAREEVLARARRPLPASSARRDPLARRARPAPSSRRRPSCPAAARAPIASVDRVERAPVRPRVGVDVERRDGDDEVGALGDRGASCRSSRAGARRRRPRAARRRGPPRRGTAARRALTSVDDALVDVAADDLVAGARDLRGQRQPDLAERDDDGLHARRRACTVSPRARARRAPPRRSATVSSPASSGTTGASSSPAT